MISIAFFGSFLVYFILQISFNTESPIVVVISPSMEPQIHKGDLLFVMGIDPENIKNGTDQGVVSEDDIIGVVVGGIPYIGWVKIF